MNIAIIGSGAMGSLFGGVLTEIGHNVTLVDIWEKHVDMMNENGLTIAKPDGNQRIINVTATTNLEAIDTIDLAIIFVKSIHTENAMDDFASEFDDRTDVLTIQNGLGNAESISEYVPKKKIIGGVTSQGAILEEAGKITHAGQGPTSIGRFFSENDQSVDRVADVFTEAGIKTDVSNSIQDAIWEKVLVNLGINAATALSQVQNGAIANTDPGRNLAKKAVIEGKSVAVQEGRTVREDIVKYVFEIARTTATNKSSMRQDLEAGRDTEIETLNGEIIRRAEIHEIEVPVNETLTELVRLAEFSNGENQKT